MHLRFLCILALAGLLLSPAGVLAQGEGPEAIVAGVPGTVRLALPDPGSIDPAVTESNAGWIIANQLFSGLTRIDPGTKAPIPDLAASWTSTFDKKVFIFTLRAGLTWSNGMPLTATDVRYGILRSLNPATASAYAFLLYKIVNAQAYHDGTATANQVGVTVLNPTQIKFTLTGSASYFPAVLATPPARPQPAAAITQWGNTWTEPGHIVTSGAYKLVQWVHGSQIVLNKWPSFYDAVHVRIPKVSIKIADEATAWSMFQAGAVDTVAVPVSELASVRANPALSPMLHQVASNCTYYYGFNTALEPFDDPLVRKAFIAAVDRQGLIDSVLQGGQLPAQTFTSPGVFGFVDGVAEGVGVPYDVTQAQDWLAQAGYAGGVGLPPVTLWFNESTGHQAIAEYIQGNWQANLNVNVTLQTLPWSDYLNELDQGTMQIWRMGWCLDYNDAYDYLGEGVVPRMATSYGGWLNGTYLSLLNQALSSANNTARLGYYRQAEEILVETDAAMLPLYFYESYALTRPYLLRPYPLQGEEHIRDWVLTHGSKTVVSTAAEDGWVLESTETSNIGGSINAAAASLRLGDEIGDKQYRGILSFNTAVVPDNAVITSATLKIKSVGAAGTNPFTTHGSLLVDVRGGPFMNNPLLQAGDFQAPAGRLAVMSIPNALVAGWYQKAMPEAGFVHINKTGVTQFRLRFFKDDNDDNGADYITFHSGNTLTAAYRPVLVITYYVP